MTGLTNGTTYYLTVAAVNKAKLQGAKSGEASATPTAASALGERVGDRARLRIAVRRGHGYRSRVAGSTDRAYRDPG